MPGLLNLNPFAKAIYREDEIIKFEGFTKSETKIEDMSAKKDKNGEEEMQTNQKRKEEKEDLREEMMEQEAN